MRFGRRQLGPGDPPYVIAELSANHGGKFDRAVELVKAAADAGADAIKTQTYTPESLTIDDDSSAFHIEGTVWSGRRLFDLYSEAMTPWDWQPELKALADRLGIDFVSSVFDDASIDYLRPLNIAAYKIASFENGDLGLLRSVGATQTPVVLSTGTATLAEIDEAVAVLRSAGCVDLALLWCVSEYPASIAQMNLRTMPFLARRFGIPTGLSDHSLSPVVPLAAVGLGARVIEKHLTLARADGGPDAAFSLEPDEFALLVRDVRAASEALGDVRLTQPDDDAAPGREFRRSLYVVRDVPAGRRLGPDDVRSIRPAGGLAPRHLLDVLGRPAARSLRRGEPLTWEMVGDP